MGTVSPLMHDMTSDQEQHEASGAQESSIKQELLFYMSFPQMFLAWLPSEAEPDASQKDNCTDDPKNIPTETI